MKQILQNMASGVTEIVDAPAPTVSAHHLLIASQVSLISSGTERMLVDFGKASYFQKARQQPEKVRMVLAKVRTDGLLATVQAVRSKLTQPLPLGYCNVGVVLDVGAGVSGFSAGDRVVSNGPHADVVKVPANLCARIPDRVASEQASFTVLASIGLQGIRLAQPTLGECFVVTGVGLIGLLTVQLLRAHGCRVMAIDFDESKLALARQFGAATCNPGSGADPVAAALAFSGNRGIDGAIITASTQSAEPVSQAARMCRKRGRIILVGVAGLALNRAEFYEKELTFQVSCSYGPGRYDPGYEQRGQDYPIGFVRWTEQRNLEAILGMFEDGQLDVAPLTTHRYPFDNATEAYRTLTDNKGALGILLQYSSLVAQRTITSVALSAPRGTALQGQAVIGVIGAGNYASRVLIPAFRANGALLHTLVSSGGTSSVVHGRNNGFIEASTSIEAVLKDEAINTIVIATRHDSHVSLTERALGAGKHVFVEKPFALTHEEIARLRVCHGQLSEQGSSGQLMVGFNRRFAPQVQKMKSLLQGVEASRSVLITVNAGAIPYDHWTQDPDIGGGRIIGEACHFIDLARYLVGYPITSIQAAAMRVSGMRVPADDNASITLTFADGSLATVLYLANGSVSFPKERIDLFCAGRVLQLDNFRRLRGYGWPGFRKFDLWQQDKGQRQCAAAFLKSLSSGEPAISPDELFEVAEATVRAAEILRKQ